MDQTPEFVPPVEQAPAVQSPPPSPIRKVFFNGVELRAGWRFLIFLILLFAVSFAASRVARHLRKAPPSKSTPVLTARGTIISDGISFLLLLGIAAVLARFEKRKLRHYGLPLRQAFGKNFWLGCLWGFVAISGLLLALRLDRNFYYGAPELSGWSIVHFAALWGLAFILVGLSEEYLLRGYPQFTLTTGMGFWPAALLFSILFAALHLGNPGETKFGLFEIVLIGLFFCFTLWRTGTLWFAVGFHAAWDWGQSFFYGTRDSGIEAKGHLLHSSFTGPDWLTGGSVGPEGSVLLAPLIVLLFILFHLAFPARAPYPDPEAIKSAPPAALPQTTFV